MTVRAEIEEQARLLCLSILQTSDTMAVIRFRAKTLLALIECHDITEEEARDRRLHALVLAGEQALKRRPLIPE